MRSAEQFRLSRRGVMAGALAPLVAPMAAAAAEPAGKVEELLGEATAQAAAAVRQLAQNTALFVGDLVTTEAKSAVTLLLGTATTVRLGPETKLRIDRFLVKAGGVLELSTGAMLFAHDPAAGPTETAVRSPFGLIAVRGTRFFAGPSNGVFGVFVYSGAVLLAGRNQFVEVLPEFGSDVAKPGDEPTPPHRWAQPRIRAAEASLLM